MRAEVDVEDVIGALFVIDGDLFVALALFGLAARVHRTAPSKSLLEPPSFPCLLLLQDELVPMAECWVLLIYLLLKNLFKTLCFFRCQALFSEQVYLHENLQFKEFLVLTVLIFFALHKTEVKDLSLVALIAKEGCHVGTYLLYLHRVRQSHGLDVDVVLLYQGFHFFLLLSQ